MDPVQPEASVVQTGLGIRYIGDHAYAFSGVKALPDSGAPENYIDFISGSGYIVGEIKISADWSGLGGNELYINFYLNELKIVHERDTGNNYVPGNLTWPILLPPFSHLEIDLSAAVPADGADVIFVGRVYGAEE